VFGLLVLAIGCRHSVDPPNDDKVGVAPAVRGSTRAPSNTIAETTYAIDNSMPGIREPRVVKGSVPTEVFADATSAYTAGLAVDEDAVYVLADTVAHRIAPGSTPQSISIENGSGAVVTRTDIVYWSKGAVWGVPKTGGKARRITKLEHQPQYFMAEGDEFAWLDMPVRDQFVIQTFDGRKVRTLLSYAGRIETSTLHAGRVFFVRRDGPQAWRIGGVATRGGEATYAAPQDGPPPAKLAVADAVYYYDVKSSDLRKLAADLSREETLAHDFICSPLAVAVRIYCPNVQGMFELARYAGAKILPLFPSRERITAVAANSRYLAWLNDTGRDRLSAKLIKLALDESN